METFTNKEELFKRLLPALKVKVKDMHKEKMLFVKESDIWGYFCHEVWPNKYNLTLCEMVEDILHTDNFKIYQNLKDGRYGKNHGE